MTDTFKSLLSFLKKEPTNDQQLIQTHQPKITIGSKPQKHTEQKKLDKQGGDSSLHQSILYEGGILTDGNKTYFSNVALLSDQSILYAFSPTNPDIDSTQMVYHSGKPLVIDNNTNMEMIGIDEQLTHTVNEDQQVVYPYFKPYPPNSIIIDTFVDGGTIQYKTADKDWTINKHKIGYLSNLRCIKPIDQHFINNALAIQLPYDVHYSTPYNTIVHIYRVKDAWTHEYHVHWVINNANILWSEDFNIGVYPIYKLTYDKLAGRVDISLPVSLLEEYGPPILVSDFTSDVYKKFDVFGDKSTIIIPNLIFRVPGDTNNTGLKIYKPSYISDISDYCVVNNYPTLTSKQLIVDTSKIGVFVFTDKFVCKKINDTFIYIDYRESEILNAYPNAQNPFYVSTVLTANDQFEKKKIALKGIQAKDFPTTLTTYTSLGQLALLNKDIVAWSTDDDY